MMVTRLLLLGLGLAHGSYYYGGFGGFGGGGFYGMGPVKCTTCPQACKDYNEKQLSLQKDPCDDTDYKTGSYCTKECNRPECARQGGTCSNDDAVASCVPEDAKKKYLKKPSNKYLNADGLMEVPMTMKFGQIKLATTNGVDPTTITTSVYYTMEWDEDRLDPSQHPGSNGISINASLPDCRDIIPSLLKIPSTVAWQPTAQITQANVEQYYWLPKMQPANKKGTYSNPSRVYTYDTTTKKAKFTTTLLATYSQAEYESDTPYFGFPFDVHTVYMFLKAKPAVQLTGCNSTWTLSAAKDNTGMLNATTDGEYLLDIDKAHTYSIAEMNKILPASRDWNFDNVETDGPQVKIYLDGTDTCVVKMRLRRNPTVYILKAFLPDLIVMCIGMASLFINPQIPPLFGGRCSILIISMLITMNGSLNRNNGLGKLSYLLKIDFVALGNLSMLLFAMICSIIIHQCFRFKYDRLGVLLDRAVRMTLPSIIFPGVQIFEFLLLANDSSATPVTFLVAYMSISFGLIFIYYTLNFLKDKAKLHAMSIKLKNLNLADPKAPDILRAAFELFDADGSGALDAKEGRKLLKYVNPKLSRHMVAEAIKNADQNGNGIVEDDFEEMIMKWAKVTPEGGAAGDASEATTSEATTSEAAKDVEAAGLIDVQVNKDISA